MTGDTVTIKGLDGRWKAHLNLTEIFPCSQRWMRAFDKKMVQHAVVDPVNPPWEQIRRFLADHWKDWNNLQIEHLEQSKKDLEYLCQDSSMPKEDKYGWKKEIRHIDSEVRQRKKNEAKVKENIKFIEKTFLKVKL